MTKTGTHTDFNSYLEKSLPCYCLRCLLICARYKDGELAFIFTEKVLNRWSGSFISALSHAEDNNKFCFTRQEAGSVLSAFARFRVSVNPKLSFTLVEWAVDDAFKQESTSPIYPIEYILRNYGLLNDRYNDVISKKVLPYVSKFDIASLQSRGDWDQIGTYLSSIYEIFKMNRRTFLEVVDPNSLATAQKNPVKPNQ